MRATAVLFATLLLGTRVHAQAATQAPMTADLRAFVDTVGGRGSVQTRTRRLVHWINDNFTWSYTDYQKRTPEEIVARRAGNCAELASVLHVLLDTMHAKSRWIHEINVQPEQTPRRQQSAEELVAQKGFSYSIFGLQHNDHVWLEVWDDSSKTWFPADAAYGVVGLNEWLPARLALENRPKPRVAAVVPIAADMLVPFVVVTGESKNGPYHKSLTKYYLIDEFSALYGGRLQSLPAWSKWVAAVNNVSPHAQRAMNNEENLHTYTAQIAALKATYDTLAQQATRAGIHRL